MSAVLDIIIAIIIGLSVFFGAKNGFVKTAISIGSIVIAIVVVMAFAPKLQSVFLKCPAADTVRSEVNSRLAKMVSSTDDNYDPDEVKNQSEFTKLLNIIGIDGDEFDAKWQQWKQGKTEDLKDEMVNFISEPLVKAIAMILAFVVLFFGTIIALKLVAFVLDKVCVLPVLKQANTLLGILLGIALAVIKVSIFCYVVNLLLPYFQAKDIALVSKINTSSTILFKWFSKINVFSWIF
ncbi:MAG: CvpA family protein [Eubacteriales bacterium]